MKLGLNLLLLVICTLAYLSSIGQSCNELTVITFQLGQPLTTFTKPIEVMETRKKGFLINGLYASGSVAIVFEMVGAGKLVVEGAPIEIRFNDGTQLKLANMMPDSRESKSVAYFSKELGNLDQLEHFGKTIAKLKVATAGDDFMEMEIPEATAVKLSQSLMCLNKNVKDKFKVDSLRAAWAIRRTTFLPDTVRGDTIAGDDDRVFTLIEQQPEFEGGYEGMMQFIRINMNYPASARRMGIDGTVFITFIVRKDGAITDIKVLRGISKDCDAEAVRVVSLMPPWIPGRHNGKPVNVRFNLPIKFKLGR